MDALDHVENRLTVISSSLGLQVTEARLVAMDSVLKGVPRLVRDLARDLEKRCRVEVSGDSTRVDSAVVEAIGVPLLHLVRNALAHGVYACCCRVKTQIVLRGPRGVSTNKSRHNEIGRACCL